jgi:hypothetical protein
MPLAILLFRWFPFWDSKRSFVDRKGKLRGDASVLRIVLTGKV